MSGVIMERVAYRPIRGAADVAMLLTSFAVTIFPGKRGYPDPLVPVPPAAGS